MCVFLKGQLGGRLGKDACGHVETVVGRVASLCCGAALAHWQATRLQPGRQPDWQAGGWGSPTENCTTVIVGGTSTISRSHSVTMPGSTNNGSTHTCRCFHT